MAMMTTQILLFVDSPKHKNLYISKMKQYFLKKLIHYALRAIIHYDKNIFQAEVLFEISKHVV